MRQDFHFGVSAPDVGGVVVGAGNGHDDRARRVGGGRRLHDGDWTATDVMAVRGLFVHDNRNVAHVVVHRTTDHDADVAAAAVVVVVGVRRRRHLIVHRGGGQHAAAAHRLGHGSGAQLRRVATVMAADRPRADDHRSGRRIHHQVAAGPQRAGPRSVTGRAAVVDGLVVVDLQRRRLVQVQFAGVAATTDILPSAEKTVSINKFI